MWPYFLMIGFVLVMQLDCIPFLDRKKRFYLTMSVLFLFAAFRGNGRGDYFNYLNFAVEIDSVKAFLDPTFEAEVGFRAIALFANWLNLGPQWVIAAMNMISLSCTAIFIQSYSKNPMISVLVFLPFYFQFDLHAARTAVAMGISLLSFQYVEKRKLIQFLLCICSAGLFHSIAFCMLPVYLLSKLKLNNKFGFGIIAFSSILFSCFNPDSMILFSLRRLGLDNFANKYYGYVNWEDFGYPMRYLDPRIILAILVAVGCLIFWKTTRNDFENIVLNIMLMAVIIFQALHFHTFIALRISAFYTVFSIAALPSLENTISKKYGRISVANVAVSGGLLTIFTLYSLYFAYSYPPYRLFFTN